MNTVAKSSHKPFFISSLLQHGTLPINGVFILSILITAIAVIFTTNQYRVNFSEYEQLQRQHRQLLIEKNQLLTEKTYFTRHDRLKLIAMHSLSMTDPVTINYID